MKTSNCEHVVAIPCVALGSLKVDAFSFQIRTKTERSILGFLANLEFWSYLAVQMFLQTSTWVSYDVKLSSISVETEFFQQTKRS